MALGAINPQQFAEHIREHGGASMSPRTGRGPESGYLISKPGFEEQFSGHVGPEDVQQFAEKHTRALKPKGAYLGGWHEEGKTFLDVSIHMKEGKKRQALTRAQEYGQYALYDAGRGQVINTFRPNSRQYRDTLLEPLARKRETRMEWDRSQQEAMVQRTRQTLSDRQFEKEQRRKPQPKQPKQLRLF